jgi:two-component system, OmpR family, response regulator
MAGMIMIVEDEPAVARGVQVALEREGYSVAVVPTGEEALKRFADISPELVLLDVRLPGIDGFEVCRQLRRETRAPILFLTARADEVDKVVGLEIGADDYLVKPFSYAELLARLRALARRGNGERSPQLRVGELRMDPAKHRVWRGDTEIELSAKEFAVLEVFMRRPGEVLSRFQLLEHAWDYEYENRSNIVDSYVRLLRRKVDKPFGADSIQTVRGAGYRLREDGGGG